MMAFDSCDEFKPSGIHFLGPAFQLRIVVFSNPIPALTLGGAFTNLNLDIDAIEKPQRTKRTRTISSRLVQSSADLLMASPSEGDAEGRKQEEWS
jgi:hypothetical protein